MVVLNSANKEELRESVEYTKNIFSFFFGMIYER